MPRQAATRPESSYARSAGLTLCLVVVIAMSGRPVCAEVLDAHQSALPPDGCPQFYNAAGGYNLQTFLAETSGFLSRVRLGVRGHGDLSANAVLQIFDMGTGSHVVQYFGSGPHSPMGSASVAPGFIPTGVGWVDFDFQSSAIWIVAGRYYVLRIDAGAPPYAGLPYSCDNPYAAGAFWGWPPQYQPVQFSSDAGFEIYLTDPPTATSPRSWALIKTLYR